MHGVTRPFRPAVWAAGLGALIGLGWGLVLTIPSLEALFLEEGAISEGSSGSALATVVFVSAHIVLFAALLGLPTLFLCNLLRERRSRKTSAD